MNAQIYRDEINLVTGNTKVRQFNWELKDSPGVLTWLSKHELQVDRLYQREGSNERALAIASKWSWLACGVVVVAKRKEDGQFYVVDGQHRVLAAMKRSDISNLPCIVFETEGIRQEAAGFYDTNTGRKLPTTLEKWKAQLLREDPLTVFVDTLIRQAGRVPSSSGGPNEVRCLSSMLYLAKNDRSRLTKLWPMILEVCEGQALHERILMGLCWLDANLPDGQSLTERRWHERVVRVGYEGLLDAANRAATFYARGGAKVWGKGMAEAMNKGCRIRMLLRGEVPE